MEPTAATRRLARWMSDAILMSDTEVNMFSLMLTSSREIGEPLALLCRCLPPP